MHVNNVQPNPQPTFGTKVRMNPTYIKTMGSSISDKKHLKKAINILENNGVDDILFVNENFVHQGLYGPIYRTFAEVCEVTEKSFKFRDPVVTPLITDLVQLYKLAKQSPIRTWMKKDVWKDYI